MKLDNGIQVGWWTSGGCYVDYISLLHSSLLLSLLDHGVCFLKTTIHYRPCWSKQGFEQGYYCYQQGFEQVCADFALTRKNHLDLNERSDEGFNSEWKNYSRLGFSAFFIAFTFSQAHEFL